MFFGAGGPTLVSPLPGGTAENTQTHPSTSTSSLSVETGGNVVGSGNVQNFTHAWINGSFTSSDYEVRLTKTSGDDPTSGPALGSWHSLSSTRTWSLTRSGVGTLSFSGTLEIRHTSGSPSTSGTYGLISNVEI